MSFDLASFAVAVGAKADVWAGLGLAWQVGHISPNYGKPVVTGQFESETFIAEMIIWITGEAELAAARKADGWNVNKHYDLASSEDLETALLELIALITDETVPGRAVTAWDTRER